MSTDKLMNGDLGGPVYVDRRPRARPAGLQALCAAAVVLGVSALVGVLLMQNWQLKQLLSAHEERVVSLETKLQDHKDQILDRVASLESKPLEPSAAGVFSPDAQSDASMHHRAKRAANSLTLPFGGCVQGPPGRDGLAGSNGRDGLPGRDGPAGPPGAAGPPGDSGSNGSDGRDGAVGPPGPAGAPGPAGPPGHNGADGREGVAGSAGRDGRDGLSGPPGPAGPPGTCDNTPRMKDCEEVYKAGHNTSGINTIQPDAARPPFRVYCEMEAGVGGWTVIQKRFDGSVDFARDWEEYKNGFGALVGEFWLGNDKIYQISNAKTNRLRVDLENWSSETVYAEYDRFYIEDEAAKYRLHVGSYSGADRGYGLSYHNGGKFSTHDQDNDGFGNYNCATSQGGRGGWWYKSCDAANLNQPYKHGGGGTETDGIEWNGWSAHRNSIKSSVMKIRPAP